MAVEGGSFRKSVLGGFFWLSAATFAGQFVSWLSTVIVIRLLSPSDYGLMAMTMVFISLLTMISEMGIGSALIQVKELGEREIRQIFGWALISGLVGLTFCYMSAPLVAQFYNEPKLVIIVRILTINVILVMLYVVPQSLFVREMNFKVKSQIDFTAQLGTALVTLAFALGGMGIWALVAGQIAMHGIKAVGYNAARPYRVTPSFAFQGSLRLLRYGLMVTGDRLLNFIYADSDRIIVGKFLGNNLLGIYSVGLTLATIPMEKVLPIITQISFSSYARIQNDPDRIQRNLLRATRAVAFAAFPMFFGMSAVAPIAIPLILGPNWEPMIVPFQILCLVLPLRTLSPLLPPAVFAIGRPSVTLVNTLIASTTMVIAFLVGVRSGVVGVCIAWLVAYPVVVGVTTFRSLRTLGLPMGRYISEIRFPFFTSVLMLVLINVLGKMIVTPHPLFLLMLFALFGIVFYLGLTFILKREEYAGILGLLKP